MCGPDCIKSAEERKAVLERADAIITRNGKDFTASKLPVMTATEYLAKSE